MTDYAKSISLRFVEAMDLILSRKIGGCRFDKDIGDKLGIIPQNIPSLRAGKRKPTIEQLARMCDVFGVDPGWLILGIGNPIDGEDTIPIKIIEDRLEMIEASMAKLLKAKKIKIN